MIPRVVLQNAVSIDGRIDWFPADIGLFYELVARYQPEVMLFGGDTVLQSGTPQDEPGDENAGRAPESQPGDPRPLAAVLDSRGRVRSWNALRQSPYWRDAMALIARATPAEYREYLAQRGVEALETGEERVDLRAALEQLYARYAARTVYVDSGGTLNGVLLRAGLVDEVALLVHPSLVGGLSPRGMFRAPDLTSAEGVLPARLIHLEKLAGDVVWLRYEIVK
ncbi:MAG: RibD family protein [Chloroflexi bacterium]|nr:RibD family protein [Anaerolineaceae bacterium]NMB90950.1 RibD family protein [Chloroflexota bacterium]